MEKREYGIECMKCGARFSAPVGRGKPICPRCEQDVCGKCPTREGSGAREQREPDGQIGGTKK